MSSTSVMDRISVCTDLNDASYDAIVVVAESVKSVSHDLLVRTLLQFVEVDEGADKDVFLMPAAHLPAKRIIFSGTGPLNRDYDDVRRIEEAATKGVERALKAGSKAPLLAVYCSSFAKTGLLAILGALKALYVPLEARECGRPNKANLIGILSNNVKVTEEEVELARALEAGRFVSRDIGGSDPERMAAPNVEAYVRQIFPPDSNVRLDIISGQNVLEKEYPCLAAVNRCASGQTRHDGRVIWMTYEPPGPVEKTLMLVGKGITYDTGGADVKAGGIMAGMSRDKCGAASVVGILKVASILKPKNVKVVGAIAMVRNSIGSNCYVADEIVVARSGVRIRVGNTDAEGRMVMVDVLCHMKEKALSEVNPHLFTVATLTGHACLAMGPYTAVMDNGPARKENFAMKLQQTGDDYGDPCEVSSIRREDFDMNADKSGEYVDVLQCNNSASSRTPRGHQFPAAFLQTVSGLDKHMLSSSLPLKYSHIDVAGSSGDLPHPPTASSVVSMAMHFFRSSKP